MTEQASPQDTSDPCRMSARALAARYAARSLSPVEVTRATLARIDALNPRINAYCVVDHEAALAAARASEARWMQGRPLGSLDGVPTSIKDLILTRGWPTLRGSRTIDPDQPWEDDAPATARLREAGAVLLGKTTTPEFGWRASTDSALTGVTRNPWDPARSTAGSSGGAAAMVAAGVLPIAHAADGGGSIRNPASFCGLVGLKPSRGRISAAPDWGQCMSGLSVNFVLTRSVRDCAASLDAVAGPAAGDPYVIVPPSSRYVDAVAAPPPRLRIALNTRVWSGLPLDPQVAAALERTGGLLRDLGHRVEEASPEFDYDPFLDAQMTLWAAYTAQAIDDIARQTGLDPGIETLQSTTLAMYELGRQVSAVEFIEAELRYNIVTRQVARLFETCDLLLTPTCTIVPPPVEGAVLDRPGAGPRDFFDHLAPIETFTALFNATGQPALSVPLMQSREGLPIGMQLVGRFGADDVVLSLAAELERAAPWMQRRPAIHVGRE